MMLTRLLGGGRVLLVGLVEQEVGGELLVLVAGEVSLDGLIAVESQAAQLYKLRQLHDQKQGKLVRYTYTLDSIALLLSHRNSLSTRRQWSVVVAILTEQAEELLRVLGNQLSELGVAGTELLQDRLEHLGLLLDNLAKLLELCVVPEELQVAHASLPGGSSRSGSSGGSTATKRVSTAATATLLSGEVEQVHATLVLTTSGGRGGRDRSATSGRLSSRSRGALLLLDVVGDTLGQVSASATSQQPPLSRLTFSRYSTARSGLKKAARMAASIWLLSQSPWPPCLR